MLPPRGPFSIRSTVFKNAVQRCRDLADRARRLAHPDRDLGPEVRREVDDVVRAHQDVRGGEAVLQDVADVDVQNARMQRIAADHAHVAVVREARHAAEVRDHVDERHVALDRELEDVQRVVQIARRHVDVLALDVDRDHLHRDVADVGAEQDLELVADLRRGEAGDLHLIDEGHRDRALDAHLLGAGELRVVRDLDVDRVGRADDELVLVLRLGVLVAEAACIHALAEFLVVAVRTVAASRKQGQEQKQRPDSSAVHELPSERRLGLEDRGFALIDRSSPWGLGAVGPVSPWALSTFVWRKYTSAARFWLRNALPGHPATPRECLMHSGKYRRTKRPSHLDRRILSRDDYFTKQSSLFN